MATTAVVAAAGFAMVFFVIMLDLVVFQYGRGVARMAVDEAVRDASIAVDPVAVCESTGRTVIADLLGGPVGRGLDLRCSVDGGVVVAAVEGSLRSFSMLVPDLTIEEEAVNVLER